MCGGFLVAERLRITNTFVHSPLFNKNMGIRQVYRELLKPIAQSDRYYISITAREFWPKRILRDRTSIEIIPGAQSNLFSYPIFCPKAHINCILPIPWVLFIGQISDIRIKIEIEIFIRTPVNPVEVAYQSQSRHGLIC